MTAIRNLLLMSCTLLALTWSLLIPVWHDPLELSNFPVIQNQAETSTQPQENNVSLEVSEVIRATQFLGQTSQSFSPTRYGYEEVYLQELGKNSRVEYVGESQPQLNPVYTTLASFLYSQAIYADFFTRFQTVRFLSVLFYLTFVTAIYWLSKELFPKYTILPLALTAVVGFTPTLTFIGSIITDNSLLLALVTASLALSVRMLRQTIKPTDLILGILLITIGLMTHPLFYVLTILLFIAGGLSWFLYPPTSFKRRRELFLTSLIGIALLISVTLIFPEVFVSLTLYLNQLPQRMLPQFSPLFQGLIFMGASGWGYYLQKNRKRLTLKRLAPTLWIIGTTIGIISSANVIAPTITVYILITALLFFTISGLYQFWPHFIPEKYFLLITLISILSYHFVSLYSLLTSQYDTATWQTFVIQLSQYKPEIAKWPTILIPIAGAVSLLAVLCINITTFSTTSHERNS